jgi:hypothetical protein
MTMLKDDGLKFWQDVRAAVLADSTSDAQERKAALAVANERIAFHTKAAGNVVQVPSRAQGSSAVLARQASLRDRALAKYQAYRASRGFTGPSYTEMAVMSTLAHGGSVAIGAPMPTELRDTMHAAKAERDSLLEKCLRTMRRIAGRA